MSKRECEYCFSYDDDGNRICGAVNETPCIEKNYENCVIYKIMEKNDELNHRLKMSEKRVTDLHREKDNLLRHLLDARALRFVEHQIKHYLGICSLCDSADMNCNECPNRNASIFCNELKKMLEE